MKSIDDIALLKKSKEQNEESLCSLSSKIDALENKLQKGYEKLQNEINENDDADEKKPETQQVVCKHYNKGYCKH